LKFGKVGEHELFWSGIKQKVWRMKKLRLNEFGEMHAAGSLCFAVFLVFRILKYKHVYVYVVFLYLWV
jgi:hypothetical protein